jgi:hypothetical protein
MVMLLLKGRPTTWVYVGCQLLPAQAQLQQDLYSELCSVALQ